MNPIRHLDGRGGRGPRGDEDEARGRGVVGPDAGDGPAEGRVGHEGHGAYFFELRVRTDFV